MNDRAVESVLELIGHTPMVKLKRVSKDIPAEVWAKLEFYNPGCSVKDRIALKMLEEAGLITSFRDGTWVNYMLADGGQSPYAANLLGNVKHWLNEESEIVKLVAKLPMVRREEICKG